LEPLVCDEDFPPISRSACRTSRLARFCCATVGGLLLLAISSIELREPLRIHARRWLELESIWLPRAVSKEVLGEKQEAIVVPEKASPSLMKKLANVSNWPPQPLQNAGQNCWHHCGNVSGDCAWCGAGNACCRANSKFDPPECSGVTFSETRWHTCVAPVHANAVKHSTQDCFFRCGGSGYCNWCGEGNACCQKDARAWDAAECKGAFGFTREHYHQCVATIGACGFMEESDGKGGCRERAPTSAMVFYMYKAVGPYSLPHLNDSSAAGSLGGVLWYLHNEVVTNCPRKYGIDRIHRYFMSLKPTHSLHQHTGKVFDSYVKFEHAKSQAGSNKTKHWKKYGYNPGCKHVDPFRYTAAYDDVVWYSLPGACPSKDKWSKTDACKAEEPGGYCSKPDGSADCTWSSEFAGEIFLDELTGILNYDLFCTSGYLEYDLETDTGIGNDFWNHKLNKGACSRRMQEVHRLFEKRYPALPVGLDRHPCDADKV